MFCIEANQPILREPPKLGAYAFTFLAARNELAYICVRVVFGKARVINRYAPTHY